MAGFRVATNVGALNAYNALSKVNAQTQKAQLRLATQKRINSVADDTSGFTIGKALEAKVALMKSAQGNVGSAKDMLATAESQLISIRDKRHQFRSQYTSSCVLNSLSKGNEPEEYLAGSVLLWLIQAGVELFSSSA